MIEFYMKMQTLIIRYNEKGMTDEEFTKQVMAIFNNTSYTKGFDNNG